jgi:hypothetical protein
VLYSNGIERSLFCLRQHLNRLHKSALFMQAMGFLRVVKRRYQTKCW